jgi:hypothetical protein
MLKWLFQFNREELQTVERTNKDSERGKNKHTVVNKRMRQVAQIRHTKEPHDRPLDAGLQTWSC